MNTDLFKSWIQVMFHPWESVFLNHTDRKNNLITFTGIAVAALAGLGISWLIYLITGQDPEDFRGLISAWVDSKTEAPFFSWSILILLGIIAGFYDFQIVLFIFAWLLKGKGSFGMQAYLQSLFYAPLVIIQQALIVIPHIGIFLFGAVGLYSLIPTTNSLKAAHGYSTMKAILTWVLPIILNIIIILIVTLILMSRSDGS